jgi:hypothetical protein
MLYLLPFLAWIAAITSGVLLFALWEMGELRRYGGASLLGWFLAAGYCQLFGSTPVVSAIGLVFQSILAVARIVRFRRSKQAGRSARAGGRRRSPGT